MASLAANNLIPKSYTARVKVVDRVEWVHIPGVCATGAYMWGCRLQTRRL